MNKKLLLSLMYCMSVHGADTFAGPTAGDPDVIEDVEFFSSDARRRQRSRNLRGQVAALSEDQKSVLIERGGDPTIVREALQELIHHPRAVIIADLGRDALVRYAEVHRRDVARRNDAYTRKKSSSQAAERRAALSVPGIGPAAKPKLAERRAAMNMVALVPLPDTDPKDWADALRYYQWYPARLATPDTPELVQKYAEGYRKKVRDERDRKRRKADNMFAQRARKTQEEG